MFNIKIYLDENIDDDELIIFLRYNNFEVISSREIGMKGKSDEEHLKCAVANNSILLTNDKKFPRDSNSKNINHKGILIVYGNNNHKKNMKLSNIVKAFKNLQEQKLNLENNVYSLNSFIY